MNKKKQTAHRTVTTVQRPTPHQQVIDIVAAGFDANKIAIALAKENPLLFIELYLRSCAPPEKWKQDLISMNYRGEKVTAIKLLREMKGLGLKEAKDIVDNLTVKMHEMGYMISAGNSQLAPLIPATQAILDDLVDAAFRCK